MATRAPTQGSDPLQCGRTLLALNGLTGSEAATLPALYAGAAHRKDETFLTYMMAVIHVESGFRKWVVSHAGAYGLMQVTDIASEEASRQCGLPRRKAVALQDSVSNVRYGSCYLSFLNEKFEGDWIRTLITYNGGYRQLSNYELGRPLHVETANYVLRVRRALEYCHDTSRGAVLPPRVNSNSTLLMELSHPVWSNNN